MTLDTTMSDGAPPDPSLDALQHAALRAADAIETTDDTALLEAEGLAPQALRKRQLRLTALLQAEHEAPDVVAAVLRDLNLAVVDSRAALLHGAGSAPELSDGVLQSVSLAVVRSADALLAGAGEAADLVDPVLEANGLDVVHSAASLLADADGAPELSDAVTDRLDLATVRSQAALLEGATEAPDLSDAIVDAVNGPTIRLRDVLLDAAGDAPDLSEGVLERLGLRDVSADMGPMWRAEAGPAPDLSAAVMSTLGMASDAPASDGAAVESGPSNVVWLRRRWALLAVPVVAMAAAVLLFVSQALVAVAPTDDLIAFSTDVANRIEIENISTDVSAVVHVIPGDFDDLAAPTIIFIDELDEDEEEADSKVKGKTL
jgi:hypothetical protein